LSGQAFCGPDVGGFAGDATPKLFARWMGLGAMLPFARGHSEQGTIDQEPWSFGPEVILLLFLYWAWSGFF
jgi:alpha-glucosidase